jgi:hypothetical protein
MTIQQMQPPTRGRGRPRRLSPSDIHKLLDGVMAGNFVGDGSTAKKSAAAQRGRAARNAVIEVADREGIVLRKISVKTWATTEDPDQYHWAIGCKPL